MDPSVIAATARKGGRAAILISLGAATCISLPLFLATATCALFFIILPLFLLVGIPVQLAHTLLGVFSTGKYVATTETDKALVRSRTGSTRPGSTWRGAASTRSSSRLTEPEAEDPIALHSSHIPAVADTPRSILGLLLTDGNESAGAPTPPDPGTLEPNPFVESPVDYIVPPRTSSLEQLSGGLLEEVARHLPERSLSTLASVSKRFGSQFRFRRLHSGTEDCALPTFLIVKQEPRLGEYTTRLVVHSTFFRPPAKMQWLLEGADESVRTTSWNSTEAKKQGLLEGVLRACPCIRSLTWNEGNLPLIPGVTNAIHSLCTTSLRDLDLPANCRLIGHLNESLAPDSMRLISLTLRGGFSEDSSSAVIGFFLLSKKIRRVYFVDADFAASREDARIILSAFLQEHSPVQRIIFVRPCDLEAIDIPIRHTRELFIQDPYSHSVDQLTLFHQFRFQVPAAGCVFSNLIALVFKTTSLFVFNEAGGVQDPELVDGLQSLCSVVSASPNLRVFSLNAEFVRTWGWASAPGVPQNLLNAITSRRNLISLSLASFTLTGERLQAICGSLSQLKHLCVVMGGEAVKISTYSRNFSRLTHLIALDMALRSLDAQCACGHDRDSRIPHREEGTAMGRLCRRIQPPTALAVVRLSQGSWTPQGASNGTTQIASMMGSNSELRWIGPLGVAMQRLEDICGPYETEVELVEKALDPMTWLEIT